MTTWNAFTQEQKTAAERAFDSMSSVDTMTMPADAGKRQFGFSDLYAFVTGFDSTMDMELERALKLDHRLRENLDRLLAETALYHAERVAAASTGKVDIRHGEGFEIRLRESRAAPQHVYIIIELKDPAAVPPTAMFFSGSRTVCQKLMLPEPQDGTIQILENLDSEAVAAVRDIDTQIFLR